MEDNHKYWKLTSKNGGPTITIITSPENEKIIQILKDEYDVKEISPDPELLKNAKPITMLEAPAPSKELTPLPKIEDTFLPSFKEIQRKERQFQKQQHRYAARLGGWKKK